MAAEVRWIPDNDVDSCANCQKRFGTFLRRHHCRLCGRIYCDGCSSGRAVIPAEVGVCGGGDDGGGDEGARARVCDRCEELLGLFENFSEVSSGSEKTRLAVCLCRVTGTAMPGVFATIAVRLGALNACTRVLLKSGDMHCLANTALALSNLFMRAQGYAVRITAQAEMIVPALVRMIESGDRNAGYAACVAVSHLGADEHTCLSFGKAGAVHAVASWLMGGDVDGHCRTVGMAALTGLCRVALNRRILLEIPHAVERVLGDSDGQHEEGTVRACGLVGMLARGVPSRTSGKVGDVMLVSLLDAGAMTVLLRGMMTAQQAIVGSAAASADRPLPVLLRDEDVVSALRTVRVCAHAIALLSRSPAMGRFLGSAGAGGQGALVRRPRLLSDLLAQMLGFVAVEADTVVPLMIEAEERAVLARVLSSDAFVGNATLVALSHFARFGHAWTVDYAPLAVQLLTGRNGVGVATAEVVRASACMFLASLCHHHRTALDRSGAVSDSGAATMEALIVYQGAVPMLVAMLTADLDHTTAHATAHATAHTTAHATAHTTAHTTAHADARAVYAMMVVTALADDKDGRDALARHGALEALVALIGSDNDALQALVLRAVALACTSVACAMRLSRAGALEAAVDVLSTLVARDAQAFAQTNTPRRTRCSRAGADTFVAAWAVASLVANGASCVGAAAGPNQGEQLLTMLGEHWRAMYGPDADTGELPLGAPCPAPAVVPGQLLRLATAQATPVRVWLVEALALLTFPETAPPAGHEPAAAETDAPTVRLSPEDYRTVLSMAFVMVDTPSRHVLAGVGRIIWHVCLPDNTRVPAQVRRLFVSDRRTKHVVEMLETSHYADTRAIGARLSSLTSAPATTPTPTTTATPTPTPATTTTTVPTAAGGDAVAGKVTRTTSAVDLKALLDYRRTLSPRGEPPLP